MSVYSSSEESSEAADEYEGSSANCYECWKVFQGEEKTRAVGCDTPTADGGSTQNVQMWISGGKHPRK